MRSPPLPLSSDHSFFVAHIQYKCIPTAVIADETALKRRYVNHRETKSVLFRILDLASQLLPGMEHHVAVAAISCNCQERAPGTAHQGHLGLLPTKPEAETRAWSTVYYGKA
jgi:hypothetical protein